MASNIGKVKVSFQVFNEVPINKRSRQEVNKFFGEQSINTKDRYQYVGTNVGINPRPIYGASLNRRVPIRKPNFLIGSDNQLFQPQGFAPINEKSGILPTSDKSLQLSRRTSSSGGATVTFGLSGSQIQSIQTTEAEHHAWKIIEPWYKQYQDKIDPDKIDEARRKDSGEGGEVTPIGQVWANGSVPTEDGKRFRIRTPYQKKSPLGNDKTVYGSVDGDIKGGAHWALQKFKKIPVNQPFFVELYIDSATPGGLSDEDIDAVESNFSKFPDFSKLTFGEDDVGIKLVDQTYFVVKLPSETTAVDYFIVIQPTRFPTFYMLNKSSTQFSQDPISGDALNAEVPEITQLSVYSKVQSEDFIKKAFNTNGKGYLRLEFIPLANSLVIWNNVQPTEPWIVQRIDPVYDSEPFKNADGETEFTDNGEFLKRKQIGAKQNSVNFQGHIEVYGGNCTGLVNFGYVRYEANGSITTPPIPFELRAGSDQKEAELFFSIQGSGSNSTVKSRGSSKDKRSDVKRYFLESDFLESKRLSPKPNLSPPGNPGTNIRSRKLSGFPKRSTPFNVEFAWEIRLESANTVAEDYLIINGRSPTIWGIRFFLPEGDPGDGLSLLADISKDVMKISENYNSPNYQIIEHSLDVTVQNNLVPGQYVPSFDYNKFIDRVHFVQMAAGFENGVGTPFDINQPSFTGLMHGGSRKTTAPLETFELKCSDPLILLEKQLMLNSPIYDGAFSKFVVEDIAIRAGFGKADSNGILKVILDTSSQLSMPLSANLTKPKFRIEDKTNLKDAILRVAKRDWAVLYCDGEGNLRYADLAGGRRGEQDKALRNLKKDFFRNIRDADGDETAVIHENYTITRDAMDAVNSILVQTVNADTTSDEYLSIILMNDVNYASVYNPDSPGYLGFKKPFLISETALGGEGQARAYLEELKRMYTPPIDISFSCWGIAGLKALDIIRVDGQLARIITVNSEIDPSTNKYWSNITAEWFFASPKNNT